MEELTKWTDTDAPVLGPYPISRDGLKKILVKAYNITKQPRDFYPKIEDIDDLLESEPFQRSSWVREDAFKLFILCIVWGFRRDRLWHDANPGHTRATADNLYTYVTTPYTGEDSYELHVGVWDDSVPEDIREDRQAAFEYMQSIITDESIYQIVDTDKRKNGGAA